MDTGDSGEVRERREVYLSCRKFTEGKRTTVVGHFGGSNSETEREIFPVMGEGVGVSNA